MTVICKHNSMAYSYFFQIQALEEMLQQAQWSHLGALWDATARDDLNMLWHKLDGKYLNKIP
jgi:hypothetical protein